MTEKTALSELLEELRRLLPIIADRYKVETLGVFGSYVREEENARSDLDLLVVKAGSVHRGRLTEKIYMNLLGAGQAVDIVVVTTEDIERYGNAPCLIIAPALQEGRTIYERPAPLTG
jgi:predicted nucleotidyltransferase